MSLRFRNSAILIAVAAIAACGREARHSPKPDTHLIAASPDTIYPGNAGPPAPDQRAAAYANNAPAIAKGQQLFLWMNCVGCHSHGGGGMGPPLMDDKWRYGGRIDQIAASISEGRPNGMPAWRDKLTQDQIWQLAAYVRTLSGQERKDAVSARTDTMSNTPPQTQMTRKPTVQADSDKQ